MSRRDWSALRNVAENIRAGDRNYWSLLKFPELKFGQASDAIRELVQAGVVSVTGYRVEPTEAFHSWLLDLRQREDVRRIYGSAGAPDISPRASRLENAPAQAPSSARQLRPESGHSAPPSNGTGGQRPVAAASKEPSKTVLAVRILERLAGRQLDHRDVGLPVSGESSMGKLRRALNAYRFAHWDNAVALCRQLRAVEVGADGGVRILSVPACLFPAPPHRRPSAGRHRSARDLEQRRKWREQKIQEKAADREDDPLAEMRSEIREWFLQGSR